MQTINVTQGDTVVIAATLLSAGSAQSLAGSTVTLYMRPNGSDVVTAKSMTIVSAPAGTVSVTITSTETATYAVGGIQCQIEVIFGDGTVETWPDSPSGGHFYLAVAEQLSS